MNDNSIDKNIIARKDIEKKNSLVALRLVRGEKVLLKFLYN